MYAMRFLASTLVNLAIAAMLLLLPFLVGLTASAPYDPWADSDSDEDTDIFDIVIAAGNYGKSW